MRPLRDIAVEIATDWREIKHAGAREALECMKTMGDITEPFYADPNGYSVVAAFLSGADHGWRGPVADRVKKELRTMCAHPRP